MKALSFGKYLNSKVCCMCNKTFNPNVKNLKEVHYHCHFSGRYQEAVHGICNLRLRYSVPREFQIGFDIGSN